MTRGDRSAVSGSWRERLRLPGPRPAPAPTRAELEVIRRIVVIMFLGGAVVSVATVASWSEGWADAAVQSAVGGAFALLAIEVAVVRRPPLWLLQAHGAAALPLTGIDIALADPVGMTPVYLLWPVVLIAWFSSGRALLGHLAWMVTVLVVALSANPGATQRVDTVIATVSTTALISILVTFLTRRHDLVRAELALAAETDPLTGLLNRRAFEARAAAALDASRGTGLPLSVVLIDLDLFKAINDEHGHQVGDEVLTRVGMVLRSTSRDGDLVARLGGEEFVVLLPGATGDDAVAFTTRLAQSLAAQVVGDLPLPTASAGVATRTDAAEPVELLVRRADAAMYAAKAAGRHRTAVWGAATTVDVAVPARAPSGTG